MNATHPFPRLHHPPHHCQSPRMDRFLVYLSRKCGHQPDTCLALLLLESSPDLLYLGKSCRDLPQNCSLLLRHWKEALRKEEPKWKRAQTKALKGLPQLIDRYVHICARGERSGKTQQNIFTLMAQWQVSIKPTWQHDRKIVLFLPKGMEGRSYFYILYKNKELPDFRRNTLSCCKDYEHLSYNSQFKIHSYEIKKRR